MKKTIKHDKLWHFIICLIVSTICPLFALGLALGKEFGDYWNGSKWDWKDILADIGGIVLGSALHVLLICLIFKLV